MRLFVIVLLSLFALPSAAQTVHQEVFEGTIGKSPVVLEITTYRDKARTIRSGQYFYTKYRTPIRLMSGQGELTFTEVDARCRDEACPAEATLRLGAVGDGLAGTWQGVGKPTSVPVTLRRIGTSQYLLKQPVTESGELSSRLADNDALAVVEGNLFLQRLYDSDLVEGPEVHTAGVAYRMVRHGGSGIRYVRLTQHTDPAMQKAVNARLDLHRYQNQAWALECAAMAREEPNFSFSGFEDIHVAVTYLTPTLMFVEEAGSTDCGGAHPNNFWTQARYDLKTGGSLDMNGLLKLYDTPAGWQEGDERPETASYKALKAKLTPKSPWFVAEEDIPDCRLDEISYPYSLSFNDKGLVFSLRDLPYVIAACDGDYYVVPYAELKSLWRPEAKAYFPNL